MDFFFFVSSESILLKENNVTDKNTKQHIYLADKQKQRKNTNLSKGERQTGAEDDPPF